MKDKITYDFEQLCQIVEQIRKECPWDKEQTHESLKTCLTNESQEVLEGIDLYKNTGNGENLCEELGDVLLQVLLHSIIAQEEGIFTLEDVIQGIAKKMVRRHPHVFGNGELLSWEEIKRREKAGEL